MKRADVERLDKRIDRLTAIQDELLREIGKLRARTAAQAEELQRIGAVVDLAEQVSLQTSEAVSTLMAMMWKVTTRLDLLTERPPIVH